MEEEKKKKQVIEWAERDNSIGKPHGIACEVGHQSIKHVKKWDHFPFHPQLDNINTAMGILNKHFCRTCHLSCIQHLQLNLQGLPSPHPYPAHVFLSLLPSLQLFCWKRFAQCSAISQVPSLLLSRRSSFHVYMKTIKIIGIIILACFPLSIVQYSATT